MTEDRMTAAYLRRLERAARVLPRDRRRELVEAIEAHIGEARRAGEPAQRVLEDLGEPTDIVAAAGGHARPGPGGQQIAAVVLLLVGGAIFFVGWLAGVVLLWTSSRWRWYDKLLGTLIWPGGLLGVALSGTLIVVGGVSSQTCTSGPSQSAHCTTQGGGGLPAWVEILIVVIVVATPIAVAIRLLRRARLAPDQAEPLVVSQPVS